jgi:hypothetical protein
MRYAICFTPPVHDPLSVAAAEWLGRNVYSGETCEQLAVSGCSVQDMAFYTAVPRRYGFHGCVKAPFTLAQDQSESSLLKAMMRFAGNVAPFEIADMDVAWLGSAFGLAPRMPSDAMSHLAASVVQAFDAFRAPLRDAEIERLDPDKLTAPQFSNLHRWGDPHVMEEYRFHMMLTGPLTLTLRQQMHDALRTHFAPLLARPLRIASLALFIEPEAGAPLRVHSQHPLGKVSAYKPAKRPPLPADPATVATPPAAAIR